MTLSNRSFTIISISAVALICISMAAWNNGWFNRAKPVVQDSPDNDSSTDNSTIRSEPGREIIGGVLRPGIDLKADNKPLGFERDSAFNHVGSTPLVKKDANRATKKIAAAIKNKNDPDRRKHLTVMAAADAFDEKAFQADPEAYLETVQPGRIWQNLPEGPDTIPIRRESEIYQRIIQGESVRLRVRVSAGSVVSFYSPRLGKFPNELTSITVQADSDGIAETKFTSTPGSHGEIPILASSPQHSRQIRFVVDVLLTDQISAGK